ncbi:MAG: hypothetical protein NZ869_10565 [Thermoanaerobaculum sp.]|nr:hypothetical protein [Thermoanaerobaculum sp.]MCX7894441.1 hypothetical protein [Thermoanaerobaculum sp.]MDW7967669.1 hypothetical protein [Thermoanaerobaculum sp.]
MTAPQVRCPLCGFSFPGERSCPRGCPFGGRCHTLCCPNCHYRFILTSPLVERFVRLWQRRPAR